MLTYKHIPQHTYTYKHAYMHIPEHTYTHMHAYMHTPHITHMHAALPPTHPPFMIPCHAAHLFLLVTGGQWDLDALHAVIKVCINPVRKENQCDATM